MSMKIKTIEVFRKSFALDGTNLTVADVPSDNMPSGIIHGFTVRLISGAITSFGSAVSDYPKVLRNITYGAKMPNFNVMTAVPGKSWDQIITTLLRKAPSRTTPTANGFACNYYLPFSWQGPDRFPSYRPKDTCLLNVNNKALPFLTLLLGPYTDLSSAATACTVTVVVEARYEPVVIPGLDNPANPILSGDQPGRMLEISVKQKADLSANPIAALLTGGNRFNIGLVLRELSAAGAEVSDIFYGGVSTPSKFEVVKGDTDGYTPRTKIETLDARMSDYFGIAVQAGYHFWLAADDGMLSKSVDLSDGGPFSLAMDNLQTTASRVLEIYQINTIALGDDVKAQQAAWLGVAK